MSNQATVNNEKFKIINRLISEKSFNKAEALAEEWRNKEFNNSEAWRASSLVYLAKKEIPEALMCVDFAERCRSAYDPNPQILKAKIYIENKDYSRADQIYDKVLKEFSQPSFINIYASVLILKADLSKQINPESTDLYLQNINSFLNTNPVILNSYYQNKLASLQHEASNDAQLNFKKNKI
jgi:tetratricopeptide (TPR) repeat protein